MEGFLPGETIRFIHPLIHVALPDPGRCHNAQSLDGPVPSVATNLAQSCPGVAIPIKNLENK